MRRWTIRGLLLLAVALLLGTSTCTANYTVGYGYTGDPYGDVFYRNPIDRYDSFYGYPY